MKNIFSLYLANLCLRNNNIQRVSEKLKLRNFKLIQNICNKIILLEIDLKNK